MDDATAILETKDYIELRAVIKVNGKETDDHFSNKWGSTWHIGLCDQETKNNVIPVIRRVYEALYQEGYYANDKRRQTLDRRAPQSSQRGYEAVS